MKFLEWLKEAGIIGLFLVGCYALALFIAFLMRLLLSAIVTLIEDIKSIFQD